MSVREIPIPGATHPTGMHSCLFVFLPVSKVWGKEIFTPVCRSVHRGSASGVWRICIEGVEGLHRGGEGSVSRGWGLHPGTEGLHPGGGRSASRGWGVCIHGVCLLGTALRRGWADFPIRYYRIRSTSGWRY